MRQIDAKRDKVRHWRKPGIWPFTVTAEAATLRKETRRLREEFTAEKRDSLFRTIEESATDEPSGKRAQAELSYYLTMFQVNSAERGARQLAIGTWVLAIATFGLVVATVVLVVVTSGHH